MIAGAIRPGAVEILLEADMAYLAELTGEAGYRLSTMKVYLEGGTADQVVRPVIAQGASELLLGEEQVIPLNAEPGWVDLDFGRQTGMVLAEEFTCGVQVGPLSENALIFSAATGTHVEADSPYGALSRSGSIDETGTLALNVLVIPPYTVPEAPDEHYARLPWELAQRVLSATGPIIGSRRVARAGWHDTEVDDTQGAVALMRTGGPLDDLVGERLKVTYRRGNYRRVVYVFAHTEQEWPPEITDEDFSLTKRAWLGLGSLATDSLVVQVEVLG